MNGMNRLINAINSLINAISYGILDVLWTPLSFLWNHDETMKSHSQGLGIFGVNMQVQMSSFIEKSIASNSWSVWDHANLSKKISKHKKRDNFAKFVSHPP